jgi:hypothetical protein
MASVHRVRRSSSAAFYLDVVSFQIQNLADHEGAINHWIEISNELIKKLYASTKINLLVS